MYSGTTFNKQSGGFIGVHQKIDRVARRNLATMPGFGPGFPSIQEILHFEGNNGPDGIKRKSPSVDEPWHYIDPTNPYDTELLTIIRDHYDNLVVALQSKNKQRAAFEAAWLAHAIVDGLTPAHHYPLGDKIEELWGKPKEERLSVIEKNVIIGNTKRETVSKNWQYWGAKGVFVTHILFELGIATTIKTHRFPNTTPNKDYIRYADDCGIEGMFLESLHKIHKLDMYHTFWQQGWNTTLARQTRQKLLPIIIHYLTYVWLSAYEESGL
ncbi:MAG: hypothetical protein WAQ25_01975 [Candidatus Saccharimonas sp.]